MSKQSGTSSTPSSVSSVTAAFDESASLLRIQLQFFFRRRLTRPEDADKIEDCVQETLLRLARNVDQGVQILNLQAYALGTAKIVFLEFLNRAKTERLIEHLESDRDHTGLVTDSEGAALEIRDACLSYCMSTLPTSDRELIQAWYAIPKGGEKVALHREMQQLFGSASTLRVRIHRIVKRLQGCCTECVKRETNEPNSH